MHNYNDSTVPTQITYTEWVIDQEHAQPHRSALGAGCCPMCGRPRCDGGRECWEYREMEWVELIAEDERRE